MKMTWHFSFGNTEKRLIKYAYIWQEIKNPFRSGHMPLALSKRNSCVMQSEIRNMTIECNRMGGINLSQGVCDTPVPEEVITGAKKAMDDGINIYTNYAGLMDLRTAIAEKHKRLYNIDVDPEKEIIVSAGATGVFYCACFVLLDPGDEVIVFEPYYGYHVSTLNVLGAVPVYVRMEPPDWHFSMDDLEKFVSPRTKGIIINTPANPSGKVFTYAELELLAAFVVRHDLFVFTDEIYEHFLYDGIKHIPPAKLPGMGERTITISGASKMFSVTGWRLGWCICEARWSQAIGFFNDLVYVCAPAPLQVGVAAGIMKLGNDYYDGLSTDFERKRTMMCDALAAAGLEPHMPQGSYYVLADISGVPGGSSKEKALYILHKTGVASVPGNAFYHDNGGEGLARFCFAKEDSILEEACERLKKLK
jgi:aminotransferase